MRRQEKEKTESSSLKVLFLQHSVSFSIVLVFVRSYFCVWCVASCCVDSLCVVRVVLYDERSVLF